jgi:hypothetical protein
VTVVKQRGEGDCGVAALASLTGIPYEDVYVQAAKVDKRHRGKNGLWNYEVVAIARRLDVRLRPITTFDLDTDEGVLRVYFTGPRSKTSPGGHFVAVKGGVIGCPADGGERPWLEWLNANSAYAGTLLRRSVKP